MSVDTILLEAFAGNLHRPPVKFHLCDYAAQYRMLSRRLPSARLLVITVLAVALAACGGQPPGEQLPAGTKRVTGSVKLPAGVGLDLSTLEVVTPYGAYLVDADGGYSAVVGEGTESEVGLETPRGELLLLGVTTGKSANLSVTSTAEALLYYLVGGMWLPADAQDTLRDLLQDSGAASQLAPHLERLLKAGGNGLMAPDADLVAALEAAHASLFPDAASAAALGPTAIC